MEEVEVIRQKKPRKDKKVLTFYERVKVILEYQNSVNPSARILSEKYGCGKTQILNILRNKKEYLEQWVNASPPHPRRPSGLFISLGVILNEWINRAKVYKSHITNEDIKKTGKEIAKILNIASFHPSNRWLERFKLKYHIDDESLKTCPSYGLFLEKKSLEISDIIIDIQHILSPDCLIPIYGLNTTSNSKSKSSRPPRQPVERIEAPLPIITSITSINDQRQQHRKSWAGDESNASGAASIEDIEGISNDFNSAIECVDITSDDDDVGAFGNNDNNDSNDASVSSHMVLSSEDAEQEVENTYVNQFGLLTYSHALEHLKSLEQFALFREDLRAVGLINQLENYLKEKKSQEEGAF